MLSFEESLHRDTTVRLEDNVQYIEIGGTLMLEDRWGNQIVTTHESFIDMVKDFIEEFGYDQSDLVTRS